MFPKDNENRSFHPTHYWREIPNADKVERPWLMYSKTQNTAYCFCCKLFQTNVPATLGSTGTKDWKNLASNLACHEKAANHQRSFHRWKELEMRLRLKATIDDQHQEKIASESLYWQNVLKRLIVILRMLATQNLALRGTSDQLYVPNNGNFLKIVELMAEFDAVLQEHLRRVTTQEMYTPHYPGKTIQNEIIQLLATKVKQKIVADLNSARYYSVILDYTPDISHNEQITLMVHFVTTTEPSENVPAMVTVREHFLEFIDIDDTTGAGMTNVLLKKLEDTGIAVADMRGQGYDNGVNMRRKNREVQIRIRELNPQAFFVPCSSRSLNSVVSNAASASSEAAEFFNHIKHQIGKIDDAIVAIMEDNAMTGTVHGRTVAEGNGITRNIHNFKFLCGLVLWHDILFEINVVSKRLQGVDLDISGAMEQLDKAKSYLQSYQSDEGFQNVLKSAQNLAEELHTEALVPPIQEYKSHRRRYFDYEAWDNPERDLKQQFKVEFFNQVLHCSIYSIFGMLYDIPKLLTISEEDLHQQCRALETALTHDDMCDIDASDLGDELKMTILFPNVFVALRILLTLPVTVASGERSFSKLKLIKTHLRSTMTQERLVGLATISTEHDLAQTVDLQEAVSNLCNQEGTESTTLIIQTDKNASELTDVNFQCIPSTI
uniref:TTF-type domain-containing protein n=1 Tax=Chelydra serpentina TaxID=8475 RepID=A0A8C3S7H5_CHESE